MCWNHVKMSFGSRIVTVRKRKKVSQSELALKIGVHANVLGRYEREEALPSVEIAGKIAIALEVSLDYLAGNINIELNKNTIKRIEDIESLLEVDKEHIFYAIDNLIKAAKSKST